VPIDPSTIITSLLAMISSGNYVGALVSVLCIACFIMWRKLHNIEKAQPTTHEEMDYNQFIEYDSYVMDELEVIRKNFDADRAVVMDLQNGAVNLANIAALKCYVRNERLKPRVGSIAPTIHGIPASFYSLALKVLAKGDNYILPDVMTIEGFDFGLFQSLIYADVKSLYAFPLMTSDGVLYGALMLEYITEIVELSDDDIHQLEVDAGKINGAILPMQKVVRTSHH